MMLFTYIEFKVKIVTAKFVLYNATRHILNVEIGVQVRGTV